MFKRLGEELTLPKYKEKCSSLPVEITSNPNLCRMYGVSAKDTSPIYKILYNGVHFTTIEKGDFVRFQAKLLELINLF